MNWARARALTDMHSRTCTRTAVSGLGLQQTAAGEPPRSARAERAARALSLGSLFAYAPAEMGPVMAALALLFVNGYGLLAVSSKAGLGARLAWTAALLLGATCVPSAAAIAAAPPSRSAAVLRSWRGAGGAAPRDARPDAAPGSALAAEGRMPARALSLRGGGEHIHSHNFDLRGGSRFSWTTSKQDDGLV